MLQWWSHRRDQYHAKFSAEVFSRSAKRFTVFLPSNDKVKICLGQANMACAMSAASTYIFFSRPTYCQSQGCLSFTNQGTFLFILFAGQYAKNYTQETYYCKYNDQILQLFATIMYFVGAFASIPGAFLSKRYGRTMTMTLAGTSFVIGKPHVSAPPLSAVSRAMTFHLLVEGLSHPCLIDVRICITLLQSQHWSI